MDLTPVIAIYGAVTGTGSLVVAGLALRAQNRALLAQVRAAGAEEPFLTAEFSTSLDRPHMCELRVWNRGGGDIAIDSVSAGRVSLTAGEPGPVAVDGPALPYRMQGKSMQLWVVQTPELFATSAYVIAAGQFIVARESI
jgi:hypothetical protein